jgi:hypothetical protein
MSERVGAVRTVMRTLSSITWIILAAAAVAGAALFWLGPPTMAREYHARSEIARFTPTAGHGLLQLGGESFLLALVAYAGRRWLRVRL